MKKYIDEELNPAKVNVIDPEKENYNPPLTIHEILLKLDISKEDYYALSISVDDDCELHLIRPPNSCFANNYFDTGLRAGQANMDIQPVFNEYKAVAYMCSCFSKFTQVIENVPFRRLLSYFARAASEKGFSLSAVCKYKFTRRTFKNTSN